MTSLRDMDWPEGKPFSFRDEPGDHDPCYIVMPDGAMLPVNHHAGLGVDIARAKFIIAACNAALLEAGVAEQPDFTYYECPECGFDVIHRADYECRSTACPVCAGDSGHDVGMNSRAARESDRPEGKDARAALATPQRTGQ